MDVGAWLRGLGLGRYEQAFRDNEIDAEVLPRLTAEDLESMGVAVVGHRRRLLDAIDALRAAIETVAAPNVAVAVSTAPAERRQLTVMFVDLVGSTALAGRLDPEDLRAAIRAYQDTCAGVITRFGGFVAKYLGDGVLAYFGWPRTREDEAERAVQAGLAVVEAVAGLAVPGGPLVARLGIATGVVVVGDLLGEGASREEAVVGETPNLAARLQQLAEPGTLVVADATHRLLGGRFDVADLGERPVRGLAGPVRAWRVLGECRVDGRFEAFHGGAALAPVIGREREMAFLLDRWGRAKAGEGQIVLLAGEPGIGKSRIAQALAERLGDEPHALLRFQCSPQRTASALHPVIARLEHAAGMRREDDPETKLVKLEALLGREVADVPSAAPLVAALLAIPTEGRYPPLALTPQQQKAKTLEALARQLETLAASRPVLLLFEDLHWADPTSFELLDTVVDRSQRLPMLVLLTFRPELAPPWAGHAHATLLSVDRLGGRDAAALAEQVAGGKPLPVEVLDRVLARAEGVPLYIEELTRAVLESGLLETAGDRHGRRGPSRPLEIPATLRDLLMARLDRLAAAKEVAQLAACIGREFSHELLAAVLPLDADALAAALDKLAASEMIHRQGAASYVFRHALLQEAAYETLLRSRRQELHARIARNVEARFPEIGVRQPEWLAHHYAEAGLTEPASACWLEAARRAKAAYALREASAHLARCLGVLTLPPPPHRDPKQAPIPGVRQLEVLDLLGDMASLMGDLEGSNAYYERALGLAPDADARTRIGNKRHLARVTVRGGARIAFYEHGGGPDTLLFVSPLAYGLATIQPVLERLCQEYRIVTVDPRGSGASDPLKRPYPLDEHLEDVRAVIAALGHRPVVGVGISSSGNLLLKLACAEPRLLTRLVTVGTPPGDFSRAFFPSAYMLERQAALAIQDVAHLVRSHTELVFSEPEMRELREQTIRSRLLLPRETILSFFDPDPGKDVMPLLAEIPVPVLVTHGREDRLVNFAAAEVITAALPDAQLYAFEGKGHLPIFTATDEFCAVLRRFVRVGTTVPGSGPEPRRASVQAW